MHRRLTVLSLACALLALAGALQAADRPPSSLHQVGDHWTAWDPPTSLPPDTEVYFIVAGDTLWDLAARFYGDPYLWPQLWERNQYILDAHWIYPGDPLTLGAEVTAVTDLATVDVEDDRFPGGEGEEAVEEAVTGVLGQEIAGGQPQPLGTETDIYCSGFVGALETVFPFQIIGSEYEALTSAVGTAAGGNLVGSYGSANTLRYGMATSDIVYVDGGRGAGLRPGDLFTIVRGDEVVIHPISGQRVGRLFSFTGRLRILSVQETTAIAEIVHSCDPVMVGAYLQPFEPAPVPLARVGSMRPINYPPAEESLAAAPVILSSQDTVVALGEDHVVYIDQGSSNDLTPGDIFSIYRLHRRGLPPVLVGELAVLSVYEQSSVARILHSRHTIYIGDRLYPK